MPLIRKRTWEENGGAGIPKPKKHRTSYTVMDNIGFKDDLHHILSYKLPDNIEDDIGRKIVSLLNSNGGIMAYGVRHNGVIYGDKITRKEQDNLNTIIDEAVKRIFPLVGLGMYRVTFTPVEETEADYQVLTIGVERGDPFKLYEDQNHEVYRREGIRMVGPLTPHQIKDITIQQLKQEMQRMVALNPPPPGAPPPGARTHPTSETASKSSTSTAASVQSTGKVSSKSSTSVQSTSKAVSKSSSVSKASSKSSTSAAASVQSTSKASSKSSTSTAASVQSTGKAASKSSASAAASVQSTGKAASKSSASAAASVQSTGKAASKSSTSAAASVQSTDKAASNPANVVKFTISKPSCPASAIPPTTSASITSAKPTPVVTAPRTSTSSSGKAPPPTTRPTPAVIASKPKPLVARVVPQPVSKAVLSDITNAVSKPSITSKPVSTVVRTKPRASLKSITPLVKTYQAVLPPPPPPPLMQYRYHSLAGAQSGSSHPAQPAVGGYAYPTSYPTPYPRRAVYDQPASTWGMQQNPQYQVTGYHQSGRHRGYYNC